MITDEKRRKVAQKLRALDMSDIEVDGCIIDSPKYVGLLLMRMLDAACDYRDGLHHFPGFFSAQAVVELFADLIDRPTCTMTYKPEWSGDELYPTEAYQCSNCGCVVNEGITGYCPSCGYIVSNYETEPER